MPRSMRLALSLAFISALPLAAQFNITVQNGDQVLSVGNGGNIVFNAPATGQSVSQTVTVTYLGAGTVTFPTAPAILGATAFSVATTPAPQTLATFASTTVKLTYTPTLTTASTAQFSWPFTQVVPGQVSGTQTTSTGEIILNLTGTAPNPILGQITAGGTFVQLSAGSTVTFPNTVVVGATGSATFAIDNAGSGPATINSISVSGAGFAIQGLPLLPLTVAPGAQISFTVQFVPTAPGAAQGSLQVSYASGSTSVLLSATAITSLLNYQVTQGPQTGPLTGGQTIRFGDVAVGSTSSAVVQVQNLSGAAVTLNTIAASGAGFAVIDAPFLPTILQPGQTASVTVRFTPNQAGPFSGRIQIGSDTFFLSGQGLSPLLQLTSTIAGASATVAPAEVVQFPALALGQQESVQFKLANIGTSPATVAGISLLSTTAGFQLSGLPSLPLQLAPGDSLTFSVLFAPQSVGQSTTTLFIGNQGFGLSGFAAAPALPAVQFTGASGAQQPFQQPAIGLSLASAYPVDVNGTLTLTPALNNFAADQAVQFSTGGRQVSFTIPANTLQAVFPGGATQIRLQTGTLAETIQITAHLTVGTPATDVTPANIPSVQFTVGAVAPVLLTASIGTRNATTLTIVVTGFTTTRSLDHLSFQLTPAKGTNIATSSVTVDAVNASQLWFQNSQSQSTGGQFTIDVPFTFTSSSTVTTGTTGTATSTSTDLTKTLSAVSVSVSNSVGTSNTLSVTIP